MLLADFKEPALLSWYKLCKQLVSGLSQRPTKGDLIQNDILNGIQTSTRHVEGQALQI